MRKKSLLVLSFIIPITIVCFVVLHGSYLRGETPTSISIASPASGSSIIAGEPLTVTILPAQGTTLNKADAWFVSPALTLPAPVSKPPFTVLLSVPSGTIGPIALNAVGVDQYGHTIQTSVPLQVEASSAPVGIQVDPTSVFLDKPGEVMAINISAAFPDGSVANISGSDNISYAVSNSKVVAVNHNGGFGVTAAAPGLSTITINAYGFSKTIVVNVGVYQLRGDLNGDGDIDQDDLNIILKALNTSSTGPGDPRDLNGDGVINALDARILVTLCTRSGCAAP